MDSFKGFQQEPEEPFRLKIETIQRPGGRRTPKGMGGCIKEPLSVISHWNQEE
jgi:hypothetical protein